MCAAAVAIAMLLSLAPVRAGDQARLDEYQVKAAFLHNFAQFVEWPAPAPRGTALVLGIVGDDRIVALVAAVVRGKSAHGRPLQVRSLRPDEDPRNCDIVFITVDEDRQAAELVRRARDGAVLTVGEGDLFLRDGGIIRFVQDGNRVRFQINANGAQQAGLKISSQLLSLAVRE